MKIRILASASRDLIEGYRFYEMQAEGDAQELSPRLNTSPSCKRPSKTRCAYTQPILMS